MRKEGWHLEGIKEGLLSLYFCFICIEHGAGERAKGQKKVDMAMGLDLSHSKELIMIASLHSTYSVPSTPLYAASHNCLAR